MENVKLKSFAKIASGSSAPKDNEFADEGIPFIRVSNLDEIMQSNNELSLSKITHEYATTKRLKLSKKNSIVFAKSGMSCLKNRVYQLNNDCYLVNHLASIYIEKDIVLPTYLKYYFDFYKPSKLVIDESYPSIRLSDIGNLSIPLPPLETQHKIISILDKAQSLIGKRKEQLELMDKLVESVFYDMFGDPVKNEKGWEVTKIINFMKIDTQMIHDFTKYKDYPHIGINNIEKDTGKLVNYKTIKEDKVISGKYLFNSEHIIYSKIRPNLNKVALPTFTGLCSADSYPLLVDSKKANRIFVALILRSEYFLNEILKHSSRTNIPKVNKKQLLSFESILPPLNLQKEFADKVSIIYKQKEQMQKSLEKMEEQFAGLMQRTFKGEIV